MVDAMGESAKVCEHLHLPVQSGSDAVLRRMERGYTAREYLEKVSLFRERVKGGVLTSDVIIGFPGERDADFEDTLRMLREARYDNIYMFKYSPRPGTPAFAMEDTLPEEVVSERFEEASRLQREMTERLHSGLVGSVQEVLVEGAVTPKGAPAGCAGCPGLGDAADPRWFAGRSRGNHRVQFYAEGGRAPPSRGCGRRENHAGRHSFFGRRLAAWCRGNGGGRIDDRDESQGSHARSAHKCAHRDSARARGRARTWPIWVGIFEAHAIAREIENFQAPPPDDARPDSRT